MKNKFLKIFKDYPILLLALNIALTVVIAFVLSYLLSISAENSFVVAIAFALTFSNVQLNFSSRSLENRIVDFDTKFSISSINDKKLKESILSLIMDSENTINQFTQKDNAKPCIEKLFLDQVYENIDKCNNNINRVKSGNIRILFDEKPEFWHNMINNISCSFFTTNVTSQYGGSYGRMNKEELLLMQKKSVERIKKQSGVFTRVFIIETAPPSPDMLNLMKEQDKIGIDVKYLTNTEYQLLATKGNWIKKIGSPDFSIIDAKYLYLTHLDEGKDMSHIEIMNDGIRLEDAITFSRIINKHAISFKC